MKKLLTGIVLALSLLLVNNASAQVTIDSSNPAIWNTSGQGSISIQVTGITGGGTITWACSVDNSTFVAYLLTPVGSSTAASTTTSNGIYSGPLGPCNSFRASISAGSASVFQRTIVAVKPRPVDLSGAGTVTSIATTSPITGGPITTTGTIECSTCLVNGGALGTPSSGTLTNTTGLPVSTGISGLGTGVATALAVNTGTAGSIQTLLFRQATVELTNAQILTVQDTPIQIVAAVGANKLLIPVTTYLRAAITASYTNLQAAAQCGVGWNVNSPDIPGAGNFVLASGFLTDGAPPDNLVAFILPSTLGASSVPNVISMNSNNIVNTALMFDCYNDGVDFTGGDAANTLRVSITYLILDVSTGIFE